MKLFKARVPPKIQLVYDWKRSHVDDFEREIAITPWHSCNVFGNIDDNYWMFETLYNDIKHKNLKQRKAKVMTQYLYTWMNSEIRKLMNKSNKQLLNIVYVIESAAYGVLCTSCLCQKPERARNERVRVFDTNNE